MIAVIAALIYFVISFSNQPLGRSVLGESVKEAGEVKRVKIKAARNEIQAAPGEVVELECEASAKGQPEIKFTSEFNAWNNSKVLSYNVAGHSKTAFANAIARTRLRSEQTQTIYCEATNGKNETDRDSIRISVSPAKRHHFSSGPWSLRNSKRQAASATLDVPRFAFFDDGYLDVMGQVAIFPCRVLGEEKSNITWLNNKEEVIVADSNERYEIRSNGDLVIKDTQWSDMGTYTCVAKNSYGQNNITTFFYPMARPSAV